MTSRLSVETRHRHAIAPPTTTSRSFDRPRRVAAHAPARRAAATAGGGGPASRQQVTYSPSMPTNRSRTRQAKGHTLGLLSALLLSNERRVLCTGDQDATRQQYRRFPIKGLCTRDRYAVRDTFLLTERPLYILVQGLCFYGSSMYYTDPAVNSPSHSIIICKYILYNIKYYIILYHYYTIQTPEKVSRAAVGGEGGREGAREGASERAR